MTSHVTSSGIPGPARTFDLKSSLCQICRMLCVLGLKGFKIRVLDFVVRSVNALLSQAAGDCVSKNLQFHSLGICNE